MARFDQRRTYFIGRLQAAGIRLIKDDLAIDLLLPDDFVLKVKPQSPTSSPRSPIRSDPPTYHSDPQEPILNRDTRSPNTANLPNKLLHLTILTLLSRCAISRLSRDWLAMEHQATHAAHLSLGLASPQLTAHCHFHRAISLFYQDRCPEALEAFRDAAPARDTYVSAPTMDAWVAKVEDAAAAAAAAAMNTPTAPFSCSWPSPSPSPSQTEGLSPSPPPHMDSPPNALSVRNGWNTSTDTLIEPSPASSFVAPVEAEDVVRGRRLQRTGEEGRRDGSSERDTRSLGDQLGAWEGDEEEDVDED